MYKKMIHVFLLITICAMAGHSEDVDVNTIVKKSDEVMQPKNLQGVFTIKLISKNRDTRTIKVKAYQKLKNKNRTDRLFVFIYPPAVRKTGLLVHSDLATDEDKMWIYLPAVGKIKRVALDTAGGGYFMGSDFTYSDLISKSSSEFIYKLQGEKNVGKDPCFEILSMGKDKAAKKKFGYSKQITYYRKKDFVIMKVVYYDLAGELLKVYTVDEVKPLGKYLYPSKVRMENRQTGHKSIIVFNKISSPANISNRYFTYRYLQNQ